MIYLSLFSVSRSLCSVDCHLFINPCKSHSGPLFDSVPCLFCCIPFLLFIKLCSISSCLQFYLGKVYAGPLFNTVFPSLLLYSLLSFSFLKLSCYLFSCILFLFLHCALQGLLCCFILVKIQFSLSFILSSYLNSCILLFFFTVLCQILVAPLKFSPVLSLILSNCFFYCVPFLFFLSLYSVGFAICKSIFLSLFLNFFFDFFFLCALQSFEEVEGAYWFGPVRLSVRPSVRYACCWL